MSLDDPDTSCLSILSTSEIVGLSFIAESGVISTAAVLVFAALVVRNVIYNKMHPGPHGETLSLIRTHVDGYMLSLLFADLLQGLGAVFSARWAANGQVVCSHYCTAQGIVQQLGETGVALNTLVITLHTFATVFFRWQPSRRPHFWIFVVAAIWLYLGLFVGIGYALHTGSRMQNGAPYYGPTPFWCWIGPTYLWERIFGEYFWLWACALVNVVLYPFLYFTLRGNIDVDPTNWRRIRFHRRGREGMFGHGVSPGAASRGTTKRDTESIKLQRGRNIEAMKMFWYPVSYTVLVLPLSITRWSTFSSRTDSSKPVADMSIVTTSAVLFIFGLSGLINVLLFFFTRPNILLFNLRRDRKRQKQLEIMSAVSFARVQQYASPSQTGLHRRRTREEEWDPDNDVTEDFERVGSPYEYQAYPPPPSERAPIPPNDEYNEKGSRSLVNLNRWATASASSLSSHLQDQPHGETHMRASTSDSVSFTSRNSPATIPIPGRHSHNHGYGDVVPVPMRKYASLRELHTQSQHIPETTNPSPGLSLSPVGFRSVNSQSPPPQSLQGGSYSRMRKGMSADHSVPGAETSEWIDDDDDADRGESSSSPLPYPPQSAYSRSARLPPPPGIPPEPDMTSPNISELPEGYPSHATTKDRVEEWALRKRS